MMVVGEVVREEEEELSEEEEGAMVISLGLKVQKEESPLF
jgi:hypothetical protein